jgi:N-methylhydantoinase A
MTVRIAIDTGGTFTDLVLFDAHSGRLFFHKVSSTPDDPGRALVQGIGEIVEQAEASGRAIELLVHGTTVATNTVIQRRGAKAAFITTAGFRDVLHIQRQDRPHMYDLRSRRAEALIPRSLRFELNERLLFDGSVQTPVDQDQLQQLIAQLKENDIEAVAVGLLHSYADPTHEIAVGQSIAAQLPDITVSLSHELVQEQGEYERFSTCAMNAFVQPIMARYLQHIEKSLDAAELTAPLFVMKSNGGVMSAAAAAQQAVQTILSGPAGGVVAGRAIAAAHHRENIITCDMGGTSFDVAVIHQGQITFAREAEMAGLALKVPMLDIHTVGAGGGSIGWIDAGGALRVGPASAGAAPGPACYGRGGDQPTVTDANLVLGRLSPTTLLGGGMQLDVEAARRAIHDHLAAALKLSVEAAAEGIIRVVNTTMTAAIRKLTVERGYDPRTFTLCPFGGAGPLHGAELAGEMGVDEVLVPLGPGVTSAVGLLMSDLREDRVRTEVSLLDDVTPERILAIIAELEKTARDRLAFATAYALQTTVQLGMRYLGQGYDLPVDITVDPFDLDVIGADFHAAHQRLYGFARRDQPVELVNIWVSVEVDLGAVHLPEIPAANGAASPVGNRDVIFNGQTCDTLIFQRDALGADTHLQGPAIIEQLDSTTVLWPEQQATVDRFGQLVLGPMPKNI